MLIKGEPRSKNIIQNSGKIFAISIIEPDPSKQPYWKISGYNAKETINSESFPENAEDLIRKIRNLDPSKKLISSLVSEIDFLSKNQVIISKLIVWDWFGVSYYYDLDEEKFVFYLEKYLEELQDQGKFFYKKRLIRKLSEEPFSYRYNLEKLRKIFKNE